MSERYKKIATLDNRYWNEKCPVQIVKGALLYDNSKEKYLIQLKFRNLSSKNIIAFTLNVDCHAIGKSEICESVIHQYLDLMVKKEDEFGDDQAIYIESNNARTFSFAIKEIIYSDNSVDNSLYEMICVPIVYPISNLGLQQEAFKSLIPSALYIPIKSESLWVCTCGEINSIHDDVCHFCGLNKENLFSSLSSERLNEKKRFLEEEQKRKKAEETQKRETAKLKAKKRNKRIILFIAIICLGTLLAYMVSPYVKKAINRNNTIKQAEIAAAQGELNTAIDLYESIGYVDDTYKELCYQMANESYESEKYEIALEYLNRISDFEGVDDLKEKCNYGQAIVAFNRSEFNRAADLFTELPQDYKNAEDLIWVCKCANTISGSWSGNPVYYRGDELNITCTFSLSLSNDGELNARINFAGSTFTMDDNNIYFQYPKSSGSGESQIIVTWRDSKHSYEFNTQNEGIEAFIRGVDQSIDEDGYLFLAKK